MSTSRAKFRSQAAIMADGDDLAKVRAFILSISITKDFSGWKQWAKDVKYAGLDLLAIFEKMQSIQSDEAKLKEDLIRLAVVIRERGTDIDAIIQKTDATLIKPLVDLKTRYTIVRNISMSRAPGTITLGRIACMIPILIAQLADAGVGQVLGAQGACPLALTFFQAPSIIPSDRSDVFNAWLAWAITADKQINSGKKGYVTDPQRVEQFGRISWNSTLLTDADRKAVFSQLNIN